jgi:hypothetical protein
MMATALGAAVSDALDDGRVVSGVGGQYNFVAMAHALPDARSVLMLRATRDGGGRIGSTILWSYGHVTIPRHLRDIYVTEYGIADVRGKADEDCIVAMAAIADARFEHRLLAEASANRKFDDALAPSRSSQRNTPQRLRDALAPLRADGTLPDYPLGSDFTEVEQRLVQALGWLKANTATRGRKLRTIAAALVSGKVADEEAMARMGLAAPKGLPESLYARLLRYALVRTDL